MRLRPAIAAMLICALAAAAVTAQQPPAPRPETGDAGQSPAMRPPERPAPEVSAPAEAAPQEKPPPQGRLIPPEPAPEATTEPAGPAMPQVLAEDDFDHSACLLALTMLGVGYEEVAPVGEAGQRDCGIARPVRIETVQPGVTLEGGALMRCATARALALWTREAVRPFSARLPGAPRLVGMLPGSTYQCRGRVGGGGTGKLSEHAFGNAIDIAAFRFEGAPDLTVQPLRDGGDGGVAFLRAVQGAACVYFTTVLGPGSNSAHDTHLHLDVALRRGGWRLCQ